LSQSGDLLALQYTGFAASVDNLTTGKVQSLTGFGALHGGTIGPDGDLYTTAWRPNDPSTAMNVLQIDPTTLKVLNTWSTGLSPRSTLNIEVRASATDNVLIYVVQGGQSVPIVSHLWSASDGGLIQFSALPANVGLYLSVIGGDAYLYGGPARNSVSQLDISSATLTESVSGLSTPDGTFILAIA
jgi:hypothetical protein